jgi:hypothetical protein
VIPFDSSALTEVVIAEWRKGKDTFEIAEGLKLKERTVLNILHAYLDGRYEMTQAGGAHATA